MKARLPALSNNQKKKARAEIEKMADEVLSQKYEQAMRRFMKITCHVLNEHYGFGKHRLSVVCSEIGKLSSEHDNDELFFEHLDRVVIDYLKMNFPRESEEENNNGTN